MALPLRPVLTVGATLVAPANLQAYLDGATYGVQAPPVTTADDMRGINEDLRFLRDAYTWATDEHDANGVHDSLQIARGWLCATWDAVGSKYVVDPRSYLMGAYARDVASLYAITRTSTGVLTVDLHASYALPSASAYAVADMSPAFYNTAQDFLHVRTQLGSRTSATKFELRRWTATDVSSMALADGSFRVTIYSEA